MRATSLGLLLAIVSAPLNLAPGLAAAPSEWPGWLGPENNAKSPDTGLLPQWPEDGPRLLWKAGDLGSGYSSVAVSGGLVYTTGDAAEKLMLSAFDLAGKRRWQVPIDAAWTSRSPGSRATPTIDEGRVYLLSGQGTLVCLDARSGKRFWSRSANEFGGKPGGWGYAESVLVDRNLAIFKPGGAQCIAALNKKTGKTQWTSSGFSAGPEYGSCIAVDFGGKRIIITGTRAGLVCVDAANGKLLWSNPWSADNTANCPTPAFADGYVFWANGYGKGGICLKLQGQGTRITAEEAWTTKDMVCHHGGYVIHEGHIYGNHSNGWSCLELATGKVKWNEKGVGKGSLCFADGKLYLFSEKNGQGALANCAPDGLQMLGSVKVEGKGPSWAHPVVIGGRLYLRYDTTLYCFNVAAK